MAANTNSSAFRALYALMVQSLTRTGVYVGTTAGYPRVEIHNIVEGERMDKEGTLRRMSCIVESMTTTSLLECNTMNMDNLDRIKGMEGSSHRGYRVEGVTFTQLQEITAPADTQNIIYRMQQGIDVFLSHTGPETPPSDNN